MKIGTPRKKSNNSGTEKLFTTEPAKERVVLIGVTAPRGDIAEVEENVEELSWDGAIESIDYPNATLICVYEGAPSGMGAVSPGTRRFGYDGGGP